MNPYLNTPEEGETTVCCTDKVASCRCVLPLGHEAEVHECDCGGSWRYVDGEFEPVTWPEFSTLREPVGEARQ